MSRKTIPGLPDLNICTIYCIGRNYVEHAHELNSEVPDQPMVFLKPASSVIFDGDTIHLPAQSNNVHHEVELITVIAKGGKNIPEETALEHAAGYGVGIDVTARDIQQQAKQKRHPWAVAKGFDTFAPISKFVAATEIRDPQNIELSISVNGEERQHDNTNLMIFPVAKLISYLSGIFTLHPGDMIFTGTPKGVSPIQSGDKIEATLDKTLAKLRVNVQ
ncbi:MAG TPA: fumarylacetoacetate hydrolase family protein [Balneolaceae bacterium]|nr:fumarylacetoacetate hydrolase family protein [Balneolaceae bacterium]